ncbi:MAG TPA: hypothetical protein ENN22_13810 [bacterium]|nr:hypothetical protein [bacterium]
MEDHNQQRQQLNNSAKTVSASQQPVPDADMISMETIVTMLVRKKICTVEELFVLEGQLQEQNQNFHHNNFINIHHNEDRVRFSGLKRKMSRRRWTRRLGTALFGWKWKKVKKSSKGNI